MQTIWRNAEYLRSISGIFQWLSIILIFLGGILQVGKFIADRREKEITFLEQNRIILQQQQKVTVLEDEISKRKEEITDLTRKSESANPYRQTIHTATVTVEVKVESSEEIGAHYMDRGGYFAFVKGSDALMVMRSTDSFAKQIGNGQVVYRGVFNLDATHNSIGKPINILKNTEYIQMGFAPMPKKMKVLGGKAICTINSNVRLEFDIPPQQMDDDFIANRKVAGVLSVLE